LEGWGQGGAMNQALYAHMNNKRKKKWKKKKKKIGAKYNLSLFFFNFHVNILPKFNSPHIS
jgi:hypothetical protein